MVQVHFSGCKNTCPVIAHKMKSTEVQTSPIAMQLQHLQRHLITATAARAAILVPSCSLYYLWFAVVGRWSLFHGTDRTGMDRNSTLFCGTDTDMLTSFKCWNAKIAALKQGDRVPEMLLAISGSVARLYWHPKFTSMVTTVIVT